MMKVSLVIPVLNEQDCIQNSIENAWRCGADEVIVVDGGSSDSTVQFAQDSNCSLVFSSKPGRANQQNHGADHASGDVVLFLHCDTWLPPNACEQIKQWLTEHPEAEAGAFEQKILSDKRLMNWIQRGNAKRVRWFNLAYGDQGIFVRKSVFQDIGGFPDVKFMEDYMLSQVLRKRNKLLLLPGPLHIDPRRWHKNGPLRQTLRNWALTAAYRIGVDPNRLANWYR